VRHELEDELSLLSVALSRSMSTGEEPTLLEDIESLHRNLKELESVRGYVQIIAHALELRFVRSFCGSALCLIRI